MPVLNKYHCKLGKPKDAIDIMRGTIFGNPVKISPFDDRASVIKKHRRYLWDRIKTDPKFACAVRDLHGQTLYCCCNPLPCHGDTLLAAAAFLHTKRGKRYCKC